MEPAPPATAAPRLALRCDGDEEIGAGHVARCVPLATAFAQRGWEPVLVGRFDGLARWIVERANLPTAPVQDGPAGLRVADWAAAVVDGYAFEDLELCALARSLPVAFVAEAARCRSAGVHLDYHADRSGFPPRPDVLAGPSYAPVDPGFAAARREREHVGGALVTVGASRGTRTLAAPAVEALRDTFPDAHIWVASGADVPAQEGVTALAFPGSLLDIVTEIDVAVSAAGLTAYELACAGVATVLVAAVPNQQRVVDGFRRAEAAITVDAGQGSDALKAAVDRLRRPQLRASLRAAGARLVDGRGAARAAAALDERWCPTAGGPAVRQ